MTRIEKVSIPQDGVKIASKLRERHAPPMEGRHEKFQLGTNPMKMTNFEKELAEKEVFEREDARKKYIRGLQGRDGGCFEHDQEKYEDTIPFNVKSSY